MPRVMPGEARKWKALRMIAASKVPLTSRDLARIYGYDGPVPPARAAVNGSPWQQCLSRIATDLKLLQRQGLIRQRGKKQEGWGKGNPRQWVITREGKLMLAAIDAQRLELLSEAPPPTAQERKAELDNYRSADRERTEALVSGIRLRVGGGMNTREQRQAAVWLRDQGCTFEQIGRALSMTGEGARMTVRAGRALADGPDATMRRELEGERNVRDGASPPGHGEEHPAA